MFLILEDLLLCAEERSVLNKGLKLIPRQSTTDEFQEKHDVETLYHRLHLKAHFDEKQPTEQQDGGPFPDASIIDNLFPKTSTWTSRPGKHSALDLYIDKCRYEISKIDFKRKSRKSNRSKRNGTHWNPWNPVKTSLSNQLTKEAASLSSAKICIYEKVIHS